MKKAAVILAGCGAKDGSEIQEATLALYALSCAGFEYSAFALDAPQAHTVCHLSDEVKEGEVRNQKEEAARIMRGEVRSIEELNVEEFDCLVIPGGTGTAKNLFTFAFDGLDFTVEPRYRAAVEAFHGARKPIGAMCIAPLSLCAIIDRVQVTLGGESELTRSVAEHFGATLGDVGREGVVIDDDNMVVTTASYMYGDSTIANIGRGAQAMVAGLVSLM